jgi:hypothetical protein
MTDQRRQEIREIIESKEPLLKPMFNIEAEIIRNKALAAAKRGEYPRSGCPHPVQAVEQFIDEDPSTRRNGRPTNLFECTICHSLLWLINPYGEAASDAQ